MCALQATFLDGFLSNFVQMTDVHQSQLYTPIVFGDAVPSVLSFIGSKIILVHILVCALTAAFLDRFLSYCVWRCILVKSTHIYPFW